MKIILITTGQATNPKIWSGTPFTIYSYLIKKGFDVENITLDANISKFEKIINKITKRIGFIQSSRNTFFFKRQSSILKEQINKYNNLPCLFISDHCIEKPIKNIKCYVYVDAVIRPIMLYKPMNIIKKIFFKCSLPIYERNDKLSLSCTSKVFTQNEWSRDYLIKNYHLNSNNVINVGFGVNLQLFKEEKDYTKNLLLIVLRKGKQIEYVKGLPLLLKAFRIVRKTIHDIQLAIVGTTGEKEEGVTYYYNTPRTKTIELFKECVLYTMPATSEPNGITYLEALANKAPILGLNRYAFPEFTENGKYGFICPEATAQSVAETIIKALSNKEKLKEMGLAGQQYVAQKYTWQKVIDTMIEIVERENVLVK